MSDKIQKILHIGEVPGSYFAAGLVDTLNNILRSFPQFLQAMTFFITFNSLFTRDHCNVSFNASVFIQPNNSSIQVH